MLIYTDDQRLLRDSATAFAADQSPVSALRSRRDAGAGLGFDAGFWRQVSDRGWAGIMVSEAHGGVDFGLTGAAILCEAMGRSLAASPFVVSSLMAAVALRQGGGGAAGPWLSRIAAGTGVVALAVDEGRKHAPASIATAAVCPDGGDWILDGVKSFVPEGGGADAFIVVARSDPQSTGEQGLSLFLVEAGERGVTVEPTATLDTRQAARLKLKGVRVGPDRLIGDRHGGFAILDRALDAGRLGLAAEMSGISQEVFARTLEYVKARKQFDRAIGSFQAIQHRLAHLHCEIEILKSSVLAAAHAADADLDSAKLEISAAKAKAEKVAELAVAESVQLHGGMGMTDELELGFFMRRVRCASEQWGDRHFHANRFAVLRGF
jgi:alkylation response protein AidB-like acyl-CoA dehydrogenase